MARVIIDHISVIFGEQQQQALDLADQGVNKNEIERNGHTTLGVHNFSATVEAGEILVLVGLSGSGKSSLLRTINGLISPIRGQVTVEDTDKVYHVNQLKSRDLKLLRSKLISMVFQQTALLPWRSVADNVGIGLEFSKVPTIRRKTIVHEHLAMVGLEDWANHTVATLSQDMQQRVSLARAFSTGAPILLMDEPFCAIDSDVKDLLQAQLKELQHRLNKTIIFASHNLNDAISIGTHIAIMDAGRLMQYGTPQEILLSPANEKVADFIKDINPISFLTARDIMLPFHREKSRGRVCAMAKSSTPIRELIKALARNQGEIGIVEKGQIIGSVSSQEIIKYLARE